jgi:hypothetical protein
MPLTMRGIAIVAAWGILVATPGWAQGTPPVKELNKKWMAAFEEGNAHALAAMYTDDAYILPPSGRMVQGTNAILDFWREQTQEFKNANLTPISTKSRLAPYTSKPRHGHSEPIRTHPRRSSWAITSPCGARLVNIGNWLSISGIQANRLPVLSRRYELI